jgi:hypothetical protein
MILILKGHLEKDFQHCFDACSQYTGTVNSCISHSLKLITLTLKGSDDIYHG